MRQILIRQPFIGTPTAIRLMDFLYSSSQNLANGPYERSIRGFLLFCRNVI